MPNDPYADVFHTTADQAVAAGEDPFWKNLFKSVAGGAADAFSGKDGFFKPMPIRRLETGSAPYAKQFDAKGPKTPGVATYEDFLNQWESRMGRFTRNQRLVKD